MYFRNGRNFSLYSNQVSVHKGPGSSQRYLWVDGDEIAALGNANPQVFHEGETIYYNGSPLPKMDPLIPDDWDKSEASIRVIDKIVIDSKGRNKENHV